MVNKRGIALLLAIIAVGTVSIGASVVLFKVSRQASAERIREYNFILESYRVGISHFQKRYNRFPKQLEELVNNDNGIPFVRRLYLDPFTLGPLSAQRDLAGNIVDVYSEVAARISQGI